MSLVNYFMTNEDKNGISYVVSTALLGPSQFNTAPYFRDQVVSNKSENDHQSETFSNRPCARSVRKRHTGFEMYGIYY